MVEHIYNGIIVNGEVLPDADNYDGIEEAERKRTLGKLATGVDYALNKQIVGSGEQRSATALAQSALFIIDQDERLKNTSSGLERHTFGHNTAPTELSAEAVSIISAYQEDIYRLGRHKTRVNSSLAIRRAAFAVIRKWGHLSMYDREAIAVTLGFGKDFFEDRSRQTPDDNTQQRSLDWRERQANDDTLKSE